MAHRVANLSSPDMEVSDVWTVDGWKAQHFTCLIRNVLVDELMSKTLRMGSGVYIPIWVDEKMAFFSKIFLEQNKDLRKSCSWSKWARNTHLPSKIRLSVETLSQRSAI